MNDMSAPKGRWVTIVRETRADVWVPEKDEPLLKDRAWLNVALRNSGSTFLLWTKTEIGMPGEDRVTV